MAKYFPGMVLPLDRDYLTAIGGVLAQWGMFEGDFDNTLWFLRLSPDAAALTADVPHRLRDRITLFKKSARACFSSMPSLAEKFVSIAGEATATSRDRNLISHGRWGVGNGTARVYAFHEGDMRHKHFTISDLEELRDRISHNHWRMLMLSEQWPNKKLVSKCLTSDETLALHEHRSRNWPPPPPPRLPQTTK